MSKPLTIRFPDALISDIESEAKRRGLSVSAVVIERCDRHSPETVEAVPSRPNPKRPGPRAPALATGRVKGFDARTGEAIYD